MSRTAAPCLMPLEQRRALADDPTVGCGNFIHAAVRANPNRAETAVWLDRPFQSISGERYGAFSLNTFNKVCDDYAGFYYAAGVREKDPVGIYVEEGVSNYIHLVALTSLGAIPVLVNGGMPAALAGPYLRRVGIVGAFFGDQHAREIEPYLEDLPLRFSFTRNLAAAVSERKWPAKFPYEHHANDVCIICHSSGTTADSKAVIGQHHQFFEGTRRRLRDGWLGGGDRVYSTMPHSHSAGVTFFMVSVTTGVPLLLGSDYHATATLPQLASFKPTVVMGFTRTFVELAAADLSKHDLRSVRQWVNVGDACHEKHIRALVPHGSRPVDGKLVAGADFLDGFGSTEMAFSLFQKYFTLDSNDYDRCIGKPHPIAEAAVIGEDGEILPANKIGRLGVKSPSVTPGYWNDSHRTCLARVKGYWLTGDIVYRDGEGRYYHLDRTTDVVKTRDGAFFTLAAEERLLMLDADIEDACVVGLPVAVELGDLAEPVGVVLLKEGSRLDAGTLAERLNEDLRKRDLHPVARIVVADRRDPWPLGSTGKVIKRHLRDRLMVAAAQLRGGVRCPPSSTRRPA